MTWMTSMTERRATRRELMRSGVAAGAVAAAAVVVVNPLLRPAPALAAPVGDVAVLLFALRAEQVMVAAYERALASGVISDTAHPVLTLFLGQEREHVDALSVSLVRLGGAVPAAPSDLASFEAELRALHIRRSPAKLLTDRQWVSFLVRVETVIATVYHFALEQLDDDRLIQTAAQIMANEGQHATVLRDLLNPGNWKLAVPRAFVGES